MKSKHTFLRACLTAVIVVTASPAIGAGNRLAVSPDDISSGQEALGGEMGPMARGEAAYRARNYDVAMDQFGLVAASSNHPFAWLRIGNIWHRRGNVPMALDAYNRARDAAAPNGQQAALFYRALMNISLLTLEQARQAVTEIGATAGGSGTAKWLGEIRLRLTELSAAVPVGTPDPTPAQAVSLAPEAVAAPVGATPVRQRAERVRR
ncbi:MAG: tetratricopeptide repeat protein [Burkholderiaceae bacterium]